MSDGTKQNPDSEMIRVPGLVEQDQTWALADELSSKLHVWEPRVSSQLKNNKLGSVTHEPWANIYSS